MFTPQCEASGFLFSLLRGVGAALAGGLSVGSSLTALLATGREPLASTPL